MIKVSLLVLAGLTVVKLLRSQSAALRHWVLWAAIACAAVVPAVEPFVPGWNVRPPRPLDRAASSAAGGHGPGSADRAGARGSAGSSAVTAHRSHHPVRRRLGALADLDDGRRDRPLPVTGRVRQADMARVTFRTAPARPLDRSRAGHCPPLRPSQARRPPAKRSSDHAGHVGMAAAEGDSARGRARLDAGSRARRALSRAGAHPARRLGRADDGGAAAFVRTGSTRSSGSRAGDCAARANRRATTRC